MTPPLTLTYRKFYEKFSKTYGPNTCVMMLVGRFYELYDFIDTKTGEPFTPIKRATEIMNIVLKQKQRTGPNGETALEAGVPEQSLHKFAQTLTREGWTVIVVDQVKNKSEEVIDRIATRVLSPGTHIETAGQDRMSVAGIWINDQAYASSVLDLTTGEVFSYTTKQADDLLHMFQVYGVKEVVASGNQIEESLARSLFGVKGLFQQLPASKYEVFTNPFQREEYFRKMFKLKAMLPVRSSLSLESVQDFLEKSLCVLLNFVEEHFLEHAERLTSHTIYCPENHMRLSNNILEQLNIITTNKQRSVLNLLERTSSALGKRTLRERILRPITDEAELIKRWNEVEYATNLPTQTKQSLEQFLRGLYDLPRLHYKISEGHLHGSEVLQLFWTYSSSACLVKNLRDTPLQCPEWLEARIDEYRNHFRRLLDEEKAKSRESDEEFCGYLTPMSGPKTISYETQIQETIQAWKRLWNSFCFEAGIPPESWKLVRKGTKDDEEIVWEGPRSYSKHILAKAKTTTILKKLDLDAKKSGPITITCEEFTKTVNTLYGLWSSLNKSLREEMVVVCDDLWNIIKEFHHDWISWLGMVDCSLALASVAKDLKWCRPSIGDSLKIKGLRHPLLETAATRVQYVTHDVSLGGNKEPGGWLIYGVNASGKSSLMKATGIAVVLAQAGSFVPATSMTLRPYDAAFSRIWTQDNVWAGLSSFAVEVSELRDILSSATSNSLVLGDEVCSGTESSSATALVASVLEHLDSKGTHFMFATHLHDLIKVPGLLPRPGVSVWHLKVDKTVDGKLIYDRKLQPGPGSCSYGLEVARAMGLPFTLMERAHQIRRALEGTASVTEAPKSTWNSSIIRQACEVCGHDVVRDLEVHHLHERAKGGSNQLRNLAVLCEKCHDRHHAGEIEIGSLVQTSEGLERVSISKSTVLSESTPTHISEKGKTKSKTCWTPEQEELIKATLKKHEGRPLTRVITDLEEEGITIKPAALKKFI
jgi:DNA mismatch repair protein MutS